MGSKVPAGPGKKAIESHRPMTTTAKAAKPRGHAGKPDRPGSASPAKGDTSKLGAVERDMAAMIARSGHNSSNHSGSMANAHRREKGTPRPAGSLREAGQDPFGGTPPVGNPFSPAGAEAPPEPMGAGPEGPSAGPVPPPPPLGQ